MRIVLIYPPPWKIHQPGDRPYPTGEGPPASMGSDVQLEGDFLRAPYGLLSIAAQALRAGHKVCTLNLANTCWVKVEQCIRRRPAIIYGLSCVTANRRGTALVAQLIRDIHPKAHIVVGGPHVTALPRECLEHYKAIDTIVMGEGEAVFMEIVDCLDTGSRPVGLPGSAWRHGKQIVVGERRPPIADVDTLASPLEQFNMHTILTSRGCPGVCTFCSSNLMWGRKVRFHSVDYVLDMLERAVNQHHQKIISIKDDTFTVQRERVLAICEGIHARQLDIEWSCETRADRLDEEMLLAMRLAGCKQISMGVESASEEVLSNIRKGISPATVLNATQMAKKFGIHTRYYMMVGNRGETYQTFQHNLDFIRSARPNQFVFTQLHLYPGSEEFDIFRQNGLVSPDIFFTHDFMFLTCFAGNPKDAAAIGAEIKAYAGVQHCWEYTVEAYQSILRRLPDLHSAHMDLCGAYLEAQEIPMAEYHLNQAIEKNYFLPGLIYNDLACIAAAKHDAVATEAYLDKAIECYPHQVVINNLQRLSTWQSEGHDTPDHPIRLSPGRHFESTFFRHHPESPESDVIQHAGFMQNVRHDDAAWDDIGGQTCQHERRTVCCRP